jgi:hypothetical protein
VQLLTEDGLSDIATEPRICHIAQSHLFHAVHNAIDGTVAVDQIIHGTGEFLARQLAPENAGYSHPPLHDSHHPLQWLYISLWVMVTAAVASLQRSSSQFAPLPTNGRARRLCSKRSTEADVVKVAC